MWRLSAIPSTDRHMTTFSLAVGVATVVLAASQHGLLLQKFNFMLGSVFQFFRANHINEL